MKTDSLGIPIYSTQDILDQIKEGNLAVLPDMLVDSSNEEVHLFNQYNEDFKLKEYTELGIDVSEFDALMQSEWLMPDEYKAFDIVNWLYNQCNTQEEVQRVSEELEAFEERNMTNLLKWLNYFVNKARENNIVWGVGRGSSVASYVLYLIGVHRINSIKYNLDWREFLR
jgi:DNA polymerase III alpha subunit